MQPFTMALYVLMWPIISAAILLLIVTAFTREIRQAKRDGKNVV